MNKDGRHGNSTHNIRSAITRLQKGQPFDGQMQTLYLDALGRRGLSDSDLDALGARGDIIRHTARLGVVVELVWGGMLMAGRMGDVESFYTILKQHGHRFDQAIRALHRELEIEREEAGVIDLTAAVDAAQEVKGNGDSQQSLRVSIL